MPMNFLILSINSVINQTFISLKLSEYHTHTQQYLFKQLKLNTHIFYKIISEMWMVDEIFY